MRSSLLYASKTHNAKNSNLGPHRPAGHGGVFGVKADKISWQGLWGGDSETVGWKTYKNEKYGYMIKYPDGWFVSDMYPFPSYDSKKPLSFAEPYDQIIISDVPIEFGVKKDLYEPKDHIPVQQLLNEKYFLISRFLNNSRMTAKNWILKDFGAGEVGFANPKIGTKIFGSNRVVEFTADNYTTTSYFIFNGQDVFEFRAQTVSFEPETRHDLNPETLYRIISTFKFVK
ncbi:MAG: hypothetical protein AAB642_00555 [Patescibacteria group bacterium]